MSLLRPGQTPEEFWEEIDELEAKCGAFVCGDPVLRKKIEDQKAGLDVGVDDTTDTFQQYQSASAQFEELTKE